MKRRTLIARLVPAASRALGARVLEPRSLTALSAAANELIE
jgi:hypothetical protein